MSQSGPRQMHLAPACQQVGAALNVGPPGCRSYAATAADCPGVFAPAPTHLPPIDATEASPSTRRPPGCAPGYKPSLQHTLGASDFNATRCSSPVYQHAQAPVLTTTGGTPDQAAGAHTRNPQHALAASARVTAPVTAAAAAPALCSEISRLRDKQKGAAGASAFRGSVRPEPARHPAQPADALAQRRAPSANDLIDGSISPVADRRAH